MTTQKVKPNLTYEDYFNTPDDERYELLDGELVMVPAPRTTHQTTGLGIKLALYTFVREHSLGHILDAPTDVVLSDTTVLQPDILFVSAERAHIITEANVQGAPDLVVEVLSPSTAERDTTTKRALYYRHGVREFWLVDTDAKTVAVLVRGRSDFESVGQYSLGDTLTSPALEGFSLGLGEIFAMA